MNMLFTLCVIILNIMQETDDLKSSAYIRELISFLILPTHLKEKNYSPIAYSRYFLKKVTGNKTHYKATINTIMTMDLENTISLISSSTKKPSYDSDSIESVTTKEINDAAADLIYNESTREITNTKDACLSSCLINTDYDKGPKCPRKGETISLCESRSNKSSKDIDSDEEDHPDDK